MRDYDIVETDHAFTPNPFCDCGPCGELCHYRYGEDDACLKQRRMHLGKELDNEHIRDGR